jgi:hypothetical protein
MQTHLHAKDASVEALYRLPQLLLDLNYICSAGCCWAGRNTRAAAADHTRRFG